jgi:hypothetical protein
MPAPALFAFASIWTEFKGDMSRYAKRAAVLGIRRKAAR